MTKTGYIAPVTNRDSNKFHTNRDCHAMPANPKEHTVNYLKTHGFEECKFCAGTFKPQNAGNRDIFMAAMNADETIVTNGGKQ